MMKYFLFFLSFSLGVQVLCQVSVFSCESINGGLVTQANIDGAGSVFQQQCIKFSGNNTYSFTGAYNKDIIATESIRIEEGNFKSGDHSPDGHTSFSIEKTVFDVEVMNYSDLTNIPKLKKLEIGVELPDPIDTQVKNFINKQQPQETWINPFLDWELDVEAEFKDPDGNVKIVDAFYYIEYERNLSANNWDEVETNYTMRVRFSPPKEGIWHCRVSIKVGNVLYTISPWFMFNVGPSEEHGYVAVHPNNRNLQLDNRMIYPVGVNLPYPTRGVNNYHTNPNGSHNFEPDETHKVTTLQNWLDYHDDIQAFNLQGGRYIRTLQSAWATLLEFEHKGDYSNRLHYAWEQDRLFEYCEANNMLVHFNLMSQEPFMKYGNYDLFDWDWSHYNSDGTYFYEDEYPGYCYSDDDNPIKQPHDMFTNDDDLKYHEQRTRYYISRYGYSTSIYLIELLSEPHHLDQVFNDPIVGNGTEAAAVAEHAIKFYQDRISHYIKSTLDHTEHLISVNIVSPEDQSMYSPDVDVVTWNKYAADPKKMIITKTLNHDHPSRIEVYDGENSYYGSFNDIYERTRKPILIAEGGPGDDIDKCSNYVPQTLDMMSFGFTGLAGFNSWQGFDEGQRILWPMIIRAQNHMNGDDVIGTLSNISGFWSQGREQSDGIKEHQYYLSEDQEKAVGYVRNRTFNGHTKATSNQGYCAEVDFGENNTLLNLGPDDSPIKVSGLKINTDYIVHWYDYENGDYMSSECFSTGFLDSDVKLNHPDLNVKPHFIGDGDPHSPLIWYVIYQYNCDAGISQFESESINTGTLQKPRVTNNGISTTETTIEPNPFRSEIRIASDIPIGEVYIFNAMMQEVFRDNISSNTIMIETEKLVAGVYFIVIPQHNYQLKMIKL